jgi:hypothetical protein
MDNVLQLILQSSIAPPSCDGVSCDEQIQAVLEPVVQSPDGPDLDGTGVPDLCQLRCGDLDLNGRIDEGDLSILLTMFGQEPVLGVGDFNPDGFIDAEDLAALTLMSTAGHPE